MTLPKITHPTFKLVIPSTKKTMLFRSFLVKEEKILLMSKTSGDSTDILSAIKQVVNNCCEEKNFNVDKLTIFDLEYLFLKIRSNSVSNKVSLTFKDSEDNKDYTFEIDLEEIQIEYPPTTNNIIKINDHVGIKMKYPSASLYDNKEFLNMGEDTLFELIIKCIDGIYQDDEMFDPSSYTREQLIDFIDSLDIKTFENIQAFLSNAPTMKHVINYKNALGNDRKIELTTLTDFFTLR